MVLPPNNRGMRLFETAKRHFAQNPVFLGTVNGLEDMSGTGSTKPAYVTAVRSEADLPFINEDDRKTKRSRQRP